MSKPPCECIRHVNGIWMYCCECSNGGDAETAAYWVADKNRQAEITALRAEVERLRAVLEVMSMMGGYTKLHPDETAPGVEQNTYSWGVSDGYKEMAEMARAALEEKP